MTPTAAERETLAEAIRRAQRIESEGRTGFVAAIMRGDTLLAWGENETHLDHDPSRHAEIVAIARAARALGISDLTGTTLLSTLQPCEMCLSAMRWTGIGRLIFAARQETVGGDYFTFPRLGISDYVAAGAAFDHAGGILEDRAAGLYRDA